MFRFIIALFAGKAAKLLLKILGRRATYFPGKVALKFCPNFMKYIGKPENIICVTGTNGKTSTCNMIEDSLRQDGLKVLDNSFGSNTLPGICATFIDGVNLFNKSICDICVLEVDERSSLHIYKYVTPTYFICTNLFRDSIMRNAHTEFIFSMINDYLPKATTLILNGDDIISSRLGKGANENRIFFGVDKLDGEQTEDFNLINDGRVCPECGAKMIFDFKRYHHIGKAHCSKCSMKSPDTDYRVTSADYDNKTVTLNYNGTEHVFPLVSETIFNIYNEVAVVALLNQLGYSDEKIAQFMKNLHITSSRYNETKAGDISVICTMMKRYNPIACSRNCHTAKIYPGKKAVFITVDDMIHEKEDSENTTWHYEADFESLNDESIRKIFVSGPRALDMKYRMMLAGIDENIITTGKNEMEIINNMELDGVDTLMIFFDMDRYDRLEKEMKPAIVKRFSKEAK